MAQYGSRYLIETVNIYLIQSCKSGQAFCARFGLTVDEMSDLVSLVRLKTGIKFHVCCKDYVTRSYLSELYMCLH